jgi:hypothetical protein
MYVRSTRNFRQRWHHHAAFRKPNEIRYGYTGCRPVATAATSLGLRYVDKDVKPKYAYNYVIMTRDINITENGLVSIKNEKDTLSRIQGFFAEP